MVPPKESSNAFQPVVIPVQCPLCQQANRQHFFTDKKRAYARCVNCQLVCVPKEYWLSSSQERAEYDLHENDLSDYGYRRFLSRISNPMQRLLTGSASGLDFGCGPAPALADMFSSAGHCMALYDKFYADDKSVLEASYDFVTASEVVEHLQQPKDTLIQLWRCVRPGGYLAIMTKRWISQERFASWHYKNDPTHIVFFHLVTFMWLAAHLKGHLTVWSDDVVILRKPEGATG